MTEQYPEILEIYADQNRGIYIPQHFAQSHNSEQWTGIDAGDLEIVARGPNQESDLDQFAYWEAWDSILASARCVVNGRECGLYQDGDLFVVALNVRVEA